MTRKYCAAIFSWATAGQKQTCSRFRVFPVLLLLLGFGIVGINSQTITGAPLTRNNVAINSSKPTVYLCVEPDTDGTVPISDNDSLWLRFYNNTTWSLRLNAENVDGKIQILKLSDGTNVGALGNGNTVKLLYGLKNSNSREPVSFNSTDWGDMPQSSWLPSDSYARFKVSRSVAINNILASQFRYEWEVQKGYVTEAHGAIHTVTLNFGNLNNVSRLECRP
ncbi:MAG TPA: hypothetical protein VGO50_03225 [Pyrinomonadaceae bacterium]|jgi:hypothetical protein|nr:hypothetical protein [Pyrinomonadaceae bacterium]